MEVKIVIPSCGRADIAESHKFVAGCTYCVPESEEQEYKKYLKGIPIITHPDAIKGIADKRQWIYDKFQDVFMMDDDLKGLTRLTQKSGESEQIKPDLAPVVEKQKVKQFWFYHKGKALIARQFADGWRA